MAKSGEVHTDGQVIPMTAADINNAGTYTVAPVTGLAGMGYMVAQAKFVYGSGGTSCKAYVQTSLDSGVTWVDIASFAFLLATATKVSAVTMQVALGAAVTPTDGTLADNTIVNGLLGDRLRIKYVVTGTYAGSTLEVDILAKG